ncbi:CBO0543 family protein [Bacillus salacetis]|uniref:CBO0543 family protein n=1 Tax=Bacillus salacetis TaxID=2315464 RepID=UPI003BA20387
MDIKMKNAFHSRELQDIYTQTDFQYWLEYELFSWNWWILVAFVIVPWALWVKVLDRKRVMEIILFGSLVVIPTTYLDAIGSDLRFWMYPTELIPVTPRAIAFDMSMVVVAYMLIYQYFSSWKSFIIALVCMALLFAFIGEPLSHVLHLVYYFKWKYIYSFVYYILLGLLNKAILEKVKRLYQ